mmetsp:Transcript_41099/g.124145  ORF Transcript_41099/g.124145 Transcript_41099/m.124145 type:complete len:219 (-) Transcript_41099:1865-2521(-)
MERGYEGLHPRTQRHNDRPTVPCASTGAPQLLHHLTLSINSPRLDVFVPQHSRLEYRFGRRGRGETVDRTGLINYSEFHDAGSEAVVTGEGRFLGTTPARAAALLVLAVLVLGFVSRGSVGRLGDVKVRASHPRRGLIGLILEQVRIERLRPELIRTIAILIIILIVGGYGDERAHSGIVTNHPRRRGGSGGGAEGQDAADARHRSGAPFGLGRERRG